FQCQTCHKHFNHKGSLKRHMRMHTNTKEYYCKACSKNFVRKDSLIKHRESRTCQLKS
ncbi:hypothetical protein CONCODRAFT_21742, partial [Conidiobolus coronatus NRRL 28638]